MPEKVKRIGIMSISSGYGGAEESILYHVNHHIAYGQSVLFIYENARLGEKLAKIKRGNLEIIKIHTGSLRNIFNYFKLSFTLRLLHERLLSCDIIVSNTYRSTFLLAALSLLRAPLKAEKYVYVRDFQQPMLKLLLHVIRPHMVIVPSKAVCDKLAFLKEWKTVIIGDMFLSKSKDSPISTGDGAALTYNLGCVANIKRWKGLGKAVDVIDILRKNFGLEIHLNIYGAVMDRRYYGQIMRKIRRLGLCDSISMKGFAENTDDIYKDNDIFLITSLDRFGGPETFSVVIPECWMSGKVPIAFCCGGPKYLIKDGYNGYLVREDPAEMAARVASLYRDGRFSGFLENGRASYAELKQEVDAALFSAFNQ